MFLDQTGETPVGLVTTFVIFLIFLSLIRVGTRSTTAWERVTVFTGAWVLLTATAALRTVAYTRRGGGSDAIAYRRHFESAQGAEGRPTLDGSGGVLGAEEPLYLGLVRIIRLYTDDYRVYFFAVAGVISFGIVYFLAKTIKAEYSVLPLVLIYPSWLYSLSAMRNWMAIAIVLVAITFYARKRVLLYYLAVFAAIGFHLSAALFLLFPAAAYIFRKADSVFAKVLFVVVMNASVFGASGLLSRLLAGTRFEHYLSWEPANISYMLPYVMLVLAAVVFAYGSDLIDDQARRVILFGVFMAGLSTLILYFGGFRYKEFGVVPIAVIASYTLYAVKSRFTTDIVARSLIYIGVYGAIWLEASSRLRSVINLSGVFPLTWFDN